MLVFVFNGALISPIVGNALIASKENAVVSASKEFLGKCANEMYLYTTENYISGTSAELSTDELNSLLAEIELELNGELYSTQNVDNTNTTIVSAFSDFPTKLKNRVENYKLVRSTNKIFKRRILCHIRGVRNKY